MMAVKKIVFVSNYFNHHQKHLSDELYKIIGDGYTFIETIPMNKARIALGWKQYSCSYLKRAYESKQSYYQCLELINNADVVITGSAPEKMIRDRIKNKKLVFRYSERPLKNGIELKKFLYRFIKYRHLNPPSHPIYMLCASAYTSSDYKKFGLFKNKAFKWGYFTEIKKYEDIDALIDTKDKTQILWCGRFLKLKHLDNVIQAFARLIKEGYCCSLKIIGSGPEALFLQEMVEQLQCEKYVSFEGTMTSEDVRLYMEKAGIYIFSSDFHEGWGAVLNESMNSACAVIASHAIGAAPFLIKEGLSGLIYESENVEDLYEKMKYLIDHPDEQRRMGKNAYHTMCNLWSPEIAAKRLFSLFENIVSGKEPPHFDDGPCSKAQYIKNHWYKKKRKENEK